MKKRFLLVLMSIVFLSGSLIQNFVPIKTTTTFGGAPVYTAFGVKESKGIATTTKWEGAPVYNGFSVKQVNPCYPEPVCRGD